MRMDVGIVVDRNTWVRTHDANVEIYTDYPLTLDVQHGAIALTGVVSTDRGDYSFLSKRFAVSRGSASTARAMVSNCICPCEMLDVSSLRTIL